MNNKMQKALALITSTIALFVILMIGSTASFADSVQSDADPLQGFNRVMYTFNDTIDKIILKPIATVL